MEILFITPHVPYPPHGGSPRRMYNILRGLSRQGHTLYLLAGRRGGDEKLEEGPIADIVQEAAGYDFGSTRWMRWIRGIVSPRPYPASRFATDSYRVAVEDFLNRRTPDVVFVNFSFMAPAAAAHADDKMKVVLDQHEDEVQHWRGYLENGRIHERLFALVTLAKLRPFERRVFDEVDAAGTVSETEARNIRGRTQTDTPIWTVPNGVDTGDFPAMGETTGPSKNIVFVGGMGVKRNADAVRWFADEVFPAIREDDPDARFFVVGSDPLPEVRALDELDGVTVTGTVPDVRPYYERANVVVIPQRFGAGTKLKALEAMAVRRPVVTTSNGVEGIRVEPRTHVRLADTADSFAREVVEVLDNPAEAMEMADRARNLVAEEYAWSRIVDDLEEKLRNLVAAAKT